ncbi:MAG: aspartate-semialdehyde dehydrogenase [Proteobacteria bacterium]|nr:aspartate-semialdehyde dehydrogenase [Candidatus Fonsibacter lacus]
MRTNIAIVGSTGNAGRKTIEVLERRKFPVNILYLLASKKSVGKFVKFRNKNIEVRSLEDFDFRKADITFFCAGSKLAKTWAPKIAKDSIVIEYSSYFRSFKNIPLIVPEVNEHAIKDYKKTNIIANPNCSTAQLVVALKPLHDKFKIKRVVTSTYQSVSGAGKAAMDELISQTKDYLRGKKIRSKKFTKQIAFNVIPHIDVFYATPAESAGSFLTYVSRIRKDPTKNAVNMWIVSDNLLKGAAFNAVQIAEVLVKKHIKNN